MKKSVFVMCLCIFGAAFVAYSQQQMNQHTLLQTEKDQPVHAWIDVDSTANKIVFKPFCRNNTRGKVTVNYDLSVTRIGASGQSSAHQSGAVSLKSLEKRTMSSSGFNILKGDLYFIDLKVYQDEKLIVRETMSYPRALCKI